MCLLCACAYNFPTVQIFQFAFQDLVMSCSLQCLLWFSRCFVTTTSHQALLCSQQPPGFKSKLVPHQHSNWGETEASPSGSPLNGWNTGYTFHFSLTLQRTTTELSVFFQSPQAVLALGKDYHGWNVTIFLTHFNVTVLGFPLSWGTESSSVVSGVLIKAFWAICCW